MTSLRPIKRSLQTSLQPMTKIQYVEIKSKPYDEMSHEEARLVISRQVGLNKKPRSAYGKADLNSIYRYITGEFYFPIDEYYTPDSPKTGEIRGAIAVIVGLDYESGLDNNRPFDLEDVRELAEFIKGRKDRRQTDE